MSTKSLPGQSEVTICQHPIKSAAPILANEIGAKRSSKWSGRASNMRRTLTQAMRTITLLVDAGCACGEPNVVVMS